MKLRDLHPEILPVATRRALEFFVASSVLHSSPWYLAGGTALGLQVGHRQSVDLDFFSPRRRFNSQQLSQKLEAQGSWRTTLERSGTLYGEILNAKVSFIAYPFFRPARPMLRCGAVSILSLEDIAVMKIIALSQRGRKRDFVDMYWYCLNKEPLSQIVPRVLTQYPGQKHSVPHILKSLTYFADAESDPMPKLFFAADWPTVKAYWQREVPKLAREIFGIP